MGFREGAARFDPKGGKPRPDSDMTAHSGDKVCAQSEIDGCDVTCCDQVFFFYFHALRSTMRFLKSDVLLDGDPQGHIYASVRGASASL